MIKVKEKLNPTIARKWKLTWWSTNAFDMTPVMWVNVKVVFVHRKTRVTSQRSGQSLHETLIRVLQETRDTLLVANAISR